MKWFRRPVRAFVAAALLVGLLPTVPGVQSSARAQTEAAEKRIYVGEGYVIERANGTATLGFPIVLSEPKPEPWEKEIQITYSTSVEDGDRATEGDDFVPVEEKKVTLPTSNSAWTGRGQVLPAEESPIVVEVNADDPSAADDVFETLSLDLSDPDGSDWELVDDRARGVIIDAPNDIADAGTHLYVSDSHVLEPGQGDAELRFQALVVNHTSDLDLRYSAFKGTADTATEGEDFTLVEEETVTLRAPPPDQTGASQVNSLRAFPVTILADEPSAGDLPVETLTVEVEAAEGSDVTVMRPEARGLIVGAESTCIFDPTSGVLTVVDPNPTYVPVALSAVGDIENNTDVEISLDTDGETILVGTDCSGGTPTVDTVDLIVVTHHSGKVTIDLSNGPLAPGIDHGDETYVDLFTDPDVTPPSADTDDTVPGIDIGSVEVEDDTPEIEVAIRSNALLGGGSLGPDSPSLTVIGSDDPERPAHVVAGWRGCASEAPPDPRCWPLNLNLNGDGDADVRVTGWHPYVTGSNDSPEATLTWEVDPLEIHGGGGDDVLSLAGGHGTGGPIIPKIDGGIPNHQIGVGDTIVDGGAGDDVLVGGGTDDEIRGGPGDDILSPGTGLENVLFGGPGDDVFDQGPTPDSRDEMSGGDGHDVVDYSKRTAPVEAFPGDNPTEESPAGEPDLRDDGEDGEGDNILTDVEEVLFPPVAAPDPVAGLDVLGELPAPRCQSEKQVAFDAPRGPCSMVVDTERNLGIAWGDHFDPEKKDELGNLAHLFVYDLDAVPGYLAAGDAEAPVPVAYARTPNNTTLVPSLARGVVDSKRMRLYGPPPDSPRGWVLGTPLEAALNAGTCSVQFLEYVDPADLDGQEFELRPGELVYAEQADCAPAATVPAGGVSPRDVPVFLPGSRLPLKLFGVAFDEGRDDLYLTGEAGVDSIRRPGGSGSEFWSPYSENGHPAMLLRKVHLDASDPDRAAVEWDVDLRYVGCGRRNPQRGVGVGGDSPEAAFVGRVGDDLLAYCWDARPMYFSDFPAMGEQGYLVRIPLDPETGEPLPREEGTGELVTDANGAYVNYRAVRTPTLVGQAQVRHDEASDSVLLVTDGPLNGNAMYVFDPETDSFVGVATGGNAAQPKSNTAVGLNSDLGRAYLLTVDGVVVFPTRERPLPGGRLFPVAANNPLRPYEEWAHSSSIAVAPALRMLVISVNLQFADAGEEVIACAPDDSGCTYRYVVARDNVPESLVEPRDPDVNTVQVDEGPGTEVRSFAEATGSGARVVYSGGPVRTVDSADPACIMVVGPINFLTTENTVIEVEPQVFGNGECAADQVLASGHREFTLAASGVEAASGTTAAAEASGLTFDENDVTARDLEAAGACEAGRLSSLTRGGFSSPDYDDGCDQFWDGATSQGEAASGDPRDPRGEVPDPRAGTRGRDGRGFPVPGTACSDFGGSPTSPEPAGIPTLASARVSCDVAAVSATAVSESAGFTISGEGDPLVSVARSESSTRTAKGPDGQVTVSAAKAEGVVVGPLSIREVRSVAVTRAKGRTGTAVTELERRWCGVTFDGGDPAPTTTSSTTTTDPFAVSAPAAATSNCIDPTSTENADFIDQVNFALGGKLRLSVTRANEETEPGGTVVEGEDSPGGYEAVLIKHDDARGGDAAVNDDDSITVAGLQAVVYNDGPKGRNRVVVQLAGVHAESRYGITELPDFTGFDGFSGFFQEPTFTPGTPGTPGFTIPGASELVEGETFETVIITRGRPGVGATDGIDNLLQWVPEAVKDLLRLLVQHPLEFLLLFGVFSLLAAPAYMAYRRRQFIGVVTS